MRLCANLVRRATMPFDKDPASLPESHRLDPALFNPGAAQGWAALMNRLGAASIAFGPSDGGHVEAMSGYGARIRVGLVGGGAVSGSVGVCFDDCEWGRDRERAAALALDALARWAGPRRLALLADARGLRWVAQSPRAPSIVKWSEALEPGSMELACEGLEHAIQACPKFKARLAKAAASGAAQANPMSAQDAAIERSVAERFPEHLRDAARAIAQRDALRGGSAAPAKAPRRSGSL